MSMKERKLCAQLRSLLRASCAILIFLGTAGVAAAGDWPGWRGDGSGTSADKGLPTQWDAKTNIAWKVEIPGEGNSSPIAWQGRIWLTSSLEKGRRRLVLCYEAASGKELWRQMLDAEKTPPPYPKNGYASPTPVTDGKQVFCFFDSPGLVALDARTGKVAWTLPLGPFYAAEYLSASPILVGDKVVQVCDCVQSTLDGQKQKGGFIVAVDKTSGKVLWRIARKPSAHAATPLPIRVGDKTQIVMPGDPTIAYDPDTGKELWSAKGMRPMCAPGPVFDGSHVWITSGRNGPTQTIDPTGSGDVTETHAKLLADNGGPYVPSPVLCPLLLLPGDDGKITFLDKTGKAVLTIEAPGHYTASPILAEGRVYWPNESGRTYVLDVTHLADKTPRVDIIAVNELGETFLASPAVADGRLLLRSVKGLYCIHGSAKVAVAATQPAQTQPSATLDQLRQRYKQHQDEEGPDIPVRMEIVQALEASKDPKAIPFLLEIVQKDNHWDVSEAAIKVLARRGAPAAEAMVTLLADRREFVKSISAETLGDLKFLPATEKILETAGHKSPLVRRSALHALGKMAQSPKADVDAIAPAILKALADADGNVKLAAIDAAGDVAALTPARGQEIVQALQAVAQDKNAQVVQAAKALLDKIASAPAE